MSSSSESPPRRASGATPGSADDFDASAGPAPTPERSWPSFDVETLEWQSADAEYGPRSGRSAHRGPYEAAVPARIADASMVLPTETMALVTEATAEIARFDGESTASPMSFAALLLRSEAASSSQIENLTSTAKAIAMAEIGRKGRQNADEIVANVAAMTRALQLADHIDTDAILSMHHALMAAHMPGRSGTWRREPVWIGGSSRSPHGAAYVAPRFERIPPAIDDLVTFLDRDDMPVLAQTAAAHAQFEAIHPFPDGNGRTGRALMHAHLRHAGLARGSIVPVSAGLLADTDRYFAALNAYRDGDLVPTVTEVAHAVFPALENSRQLVREVTDLRATWGERLRARRGAAAWGLADLVMTRPVVDAKLVAKHLGVTPANAQQAIDRLVEDGVLQQIGNGLRDRLWQATGVLEAMDDFAARGTGASFESHLRGLVRSPATTAEPRTAGPVAGR